MTIADQILAALAARLRDHASDYITHPDDACKHSDLLAAAEYLRECAQAEPVATVRVHNTGGNAGIAWSGVPTEHAGTMRGGTPLYANPQPQQAGVPEGWKLVPVEPTVEMRRAGTAANDGIVSDIYRAMIAAAPQPPSAQAAHPDNIAVDRFAAAMKAKLSKKRAEGREGWDDPSQCSVEFLARQLRDHIDKGDPVDVGNFAMMLFNRGERTNERFTQSDAVEALWRIIEAANGRQRHNPITDEMNAALRYARTVLAAQGGDR